MKRFLFPVLLLTLAVAPAMADPPDEDVLRPFFEGRSAWFFELDAGINANLLSGEPVYRERNDFEGITNVFEQGTGISPLVGLTVGYEFNSHFALTLRADYDARWSSNSGSTADTCVLRDPDDLNTIIGLTPVNVVKEFNVDVSYLTISPLLRATFRKLFIYAGPSFGIPISGNTGETDRITDTSSVCTYAPFTGAEALSTSGSISGTDAAALRIGAKIGLGYRIALSPGWSVVPQIGLDFGLNDVYSDDQPLTLETDTEIPTGVVTINRGVRLHSLQATIGIQYHL